MAFIISKMTKEQAKDVLNKVRAEIYRRSGFSNDGNYLHEERFRNYNGPISNDPFSINFDWYEISNEKVSEGYDTDVIRALQGKRSIDRLLDITDFDDAKFVEELEGIPGAFDYDSIIALLSKLSNEGFNDSNTSCRSGCTGLCEGACTNSCINGCADLCTACGGSCVSGCSNVCTGCSISCGVSCGITCGTGCSNSAVSCSDCTGGCNGCAGCTSCNGSCSAKMGASSCAGSCSSECYGNCSTESLGGSRSAFPYANCGCGGSCVSSCGSVADGIEPNYHQYQKNVKFIMNSQVVLQEALSMYYYDPETDELIVSSAFAVAPPSINARTPETEYYAREIIGWSADMDGVRYNEDQNMYYFNIDKISNVLNFTAQQKIYLEESSQSASYSSPSAISSITTTVTTESEFNLNHDSPVNIIAYDINGNQINGRDDSFDVLINESIIMVPFNSICKSGDTIKIKIKNKSVISRITVEYFDLKGSSNEMVIPAHSVVDISVATALFSYDENGNKSLIKYQNSNSNSEILQVTINGTLVNTNNTKYLKIDNQSILKYKINEKYFVTRDRHLMSFGISSLTINAKTYNPSKYTIVTN